MKKASAKAHHEAVDLYPRPFTPDELRAMLDEFDEICDLTAPKEELADQPPIDEELLVQAEVAGLSQAS